MCEYISYISHFISYKFDRMLNQTLKSRYLLVCSYYSNTILSYITYITYYIHNIIFNEIKSFTYLTTMKTHQMKPNFTHVY